MQVNNCAIAPDFCQQAMSEMQDRAASRDCDGERSMERTVKAFNAMFGKDLTTVQGWQFMELLKMARSVGGKYREDDFVDGVAYATLAGEAAADAAVSHNEGQPQSCAEVDFALVEEVLRKADGRELTPALAQELAGEVVSAHFGADEAYFRAGGFVEGDPNGGQPSSSK